jgi:hypothetical protein
VQARWSYGSPQQNHPLISSTPHRKILSTSGGPVCSFIDGQVTNHIKIQFTGPTSSYVTSQISSRAGSCPDTVDGGMTGSYDPNSLRRLSWAESTAAGAQAPQSTGTAYSANSWAGSAASQELHVNTVEEPHSTCSPSPASQETADHFEPARSPDASTDVTNDLPQVEPVDLSKPVEVKTDEPAGSKLSQEVVATGNNTEEASHQDVEPSAAAEPEMDTPCMNGSMSNSESVNGVVREEKAVAVTTVSLDQDMRVAATDLVLDPSLSLENLLEQAEGKMLTLLATEGPDGSYVILSDTLADTKDESSKSSGNEEIRTILHEPSLGEQLEAELKMIKKNLNESLTKSPVGSSCEMSDASEQNSSPSHQNESEPDSLVPVQNSASNQADDSCSEDASIKMYKKAVEKADESELFDDSFTNLENQVTDLVEYMNDPLSDFVKDENTELPVPGESAESPAESTPATRKRKLLDDSPSSAPVAKESKLDRVSRYYTQDMVETVEIEAELVGVPPDNDAASSDESPTLKASPAAWQSCQDEILSRENSLHDMDVNQEQAETRKVSKISKRMSSRRSRELERKSFSSDDQNDMDNDVSNVGADDSCSDESFSSKLANKNLLKSKRGKPKGKIKKIKSEKPSKKCKDLDMSGQDKVKKKDLRKSKAKISDSEDEEQEELPVQKTPRVKEEKSKLLAVPSDNVLESPASGGRVKRAAAKRAETKFATILPSSKREDDQADISSDENSDDSKDNFELSQEIGEKKLYRICKKGSNRYHYMCYITGYRYLLVI